MNAFKSIKTSTQFFADPAMNRYQPMPYIITPDSSNALHDFDMCLAMAQKAINSQLEYAWEAWKYNQSLQDSRGIVTLDEYGNLVVDLFKSKDKKTGKLKPVAVGFKAILSHLSVDLNVSNALRRTVRVSFHLQSGNGAYYDDDGEAVEYSFSSCSISFLTDLGRRSVDKNILAQLDPKAAQAAEAIIQASGLNDSVFSIEYLFLELGKVDMILNSEIITEETLDDAVKNSIKTKYGLLLDQELSQFMLGTVVRRNTEQATPTFALTNFLFDVSSHSADPEASSLNYLGMFSGRELPKDKALDNALIQMSGNWLRPEMVNGQKDSVAGMMVIRRDLFLDAFLIPKFEEALGLKATRTGNGGRSFTFSKSSDEKKDPHHYFTNSQGYSLTLSITPGLPQLTFQGRVSTSMSYQAKPLGVMTSELKASGYRNITGTVSLIANNVGAAFDIHLDLEHTIGEFILEEEKAKGLIKTLEAGADALKLFGIHEDSPLDMLKKQTWGITDSVSKGLDRVLKGLDLQLNQQAFIPPGGGVFAFQNLRFSNQTGDLLLDVVYLDPAVS